jgi:hypothetical protein
MTMPRSPLLVAAALLVVSGAAAAQPPRYSVADPDAVVRGGPPDFQATGRRLAFGSLVEVLDEKTAGGTTYAKVRPVDGTDEVWTAKSNLGSEKEFDPAMRPEDAIDVAGLGGLDRTMAAIYNARGKYLKEQATELGVKPSALAAVLKVESGGRGFSTDGRQIIRFENHIFRSQWGAKHAETFETHFQFDPNEKWKGHRWRKAAGGEWRTFHGNQAHEWEVLTFARSLDETAALRSASYGAGQIMGFNHKAVGYDDAAAMVKAFDAGIRPQLDAVIAFVKTHPNCMKGLKADDFVVFARCYNGAGKEVEYGGHIREAADAYRKVTRGKKHADE